MSRITRAATALIAVVALVGSCDLLGLGGTPDPGELQVFQVSGEPFGQGGYNSDNIIAEGTRIPDGETVDFGTFDRYSAEYESVHADLGFEAFFLVNVGQAEVPISSDLTVRVTSATFDHAPFRDVTGIVSAHQADAELEPGVTQRALGLNGPEGGYAGGSIDRLVDYHDHVSSALAVSSGTKEATVALYDGATRLHRFTLTISFASSRGMVHVLMDGIDDAAIEAPVSGSVYSSSPTGKIAQSSDFIHNDGTAELSFLDHQEPGEDPEYGMPAGQTTVRVTIDHDNDGSTNAGGPDLGYMATFELDGDVVLDLSSEDFSDLVDQPFTVTNGGTLPDGGFMVRFYPSGTSIPNDARLISYRVDSISDGEVSAGIGGALVPGTYDVHVFIDEDNGTDLGTSPITWDQDSGEYSAYFPGVIVTGDDIELDGAGFSN